MLQTPGLGICTLLDMRDFPDMVKVTEFRMRRVFRITWGGTI